MGVYIRKTDEMPGMREALQKLAGISEFEAYRFFDDFAGFHKEYDAYKVIHPEGTLILKKTDATSEMLGLCERAPLLIEDVLIFLNGGVHSAPVD